MKPRLFITAILFIGTHIWGIDGLDCDHGWYRFKNKCYIIYNRWGTFEEAEAACRSQHNGHLVSIHNKDEQNFLTHLLFHTYKAQDHVWIGAHRKGTSNDDGSFAWADRSPFNYTVWWPGEPNFNQKNQYCIAMWSGLEYQGKWFDYICDSDHLAVCQRVLDIKTAQLVHNKVVSNQHSVHFDLNPIFIGLCVFCIVVISIMCYLGEFTRAQRLLDDNVGVWFTRSHENGEAAQPIEPMEPPEHLEPTKLDLSITN